jgi:hypothetical protein
MDQGTLGSNFISRGLILSRYNLCKIGFWNHPELSHRGIFAINFFSVMFQTLKSIGYSHKLLKYL